MKQLDFFVPESEQYHCHHAECQGHIRDKRWIVDRPGNTEEESFCGLDCIAQHFNLNRVTLASEHFDTEQSIVRITLKEKENLKKTG